MKYLAHHPETLQVTEQNDWTILVGHVASFFPWFETTPTMTAAIQDLEMQELPAGTHEISDLGVVIVVEG